MKIVNNVLCHANTVLMAEATCLGMAYGLAPEAIRDVLEVSTGRNYLTQAPGAAAGLYGSYANERADFDGLLKGILQKDLRIAVEMMGEASMDLPGIRAIAALLESLGGETFENWRRAARASSTALQG